MPSRCVVILLDGLGDRSFPELHYMTPLQAAATPTLDSLAAIGANGFFMRTNPGCPFPVKTLIFRFSDTTGKRCHGEASWKLWAQA